jgi:hypothetical protein
MTKAILIACMLAVGVLAGECGVANCIGCLSGTCTQCEDGYFLSSNLCTPCVDPQCRTCTSSSCSLCKAGYYVQFPSKNCAPCSQLNCLNCDSNANCNTCMQGYFPVANDDGVRLCQNCGDSCSVCANASVCQQCQQGSFLVRVGAEAFCQSCGANLCATCDQEGNCLTCLNNSYVHTDPDSGDRRCFPCGSPNCLTCEGTLDLCTTCRTGYYLDPQEDDECQPCAEFGCAACSSPAACSDCLPGYRYSNAQCSACPTENCKYCNFGPCTACL